MQRNLVIAPTAASSSIEITEIDLGSALFAYNNVVIALLNYMQYKLAFTHLQIRITRFRISIISFLRKIFGISEVLVWAWFTRGVANVRSQLVSRNGRCSS